MGVPAWVQDAIFYQIFPDRFANGDPSNDPVNVRPWGEKPTIWGFQGGDLQGVIQHLDYLVDLGINAIYLNPIFQATSNHRYNTTDYYRIDPKLGSLDVFRSLLEQAHKRGLRLVLDGVFNHCGRGFFAFNDVMENQQHSPYLDWFHIKNFPLEAYKQGDAENYLGWWKFKSLPKFNTGNPQVRRYLFDVAKYWIDQGIDGWRLDVPNEIDDDEFWAEFRQVVKQTNPEAYLVGEIWKVDSRWVGPNHFDGLINYPLREALVGLIAEHSLSSKDFVQDLISLFEAYPLENTFSHYLPLGTHDTPRLTTVLKGDQRKLKLSYLMQFSCPGAPAIYYGDEIGLDGGKDPDSRRAFPWEESAWDHELRSFIRRLIQLRREHDELRRGQVAFIPCEPAGVIAMARKLPESAVLLVFNSTAGSLDVRLPVSELGWVETQVIDELLMDEQHVVSEGKVGLHLTPFQGILMHGSSGAR
jgi:cyclomaltodextrinase